MGEGQRALLGDGAVPKLSKLSLLHTARRFVTSPVNNLVRDKKAVILFPLYKHNALI
jgi:hypothetical protein